MTYIELFGPPGAGKSSLHSHMITNKNIYGGTKDGGTRRMLLKKVGRKYRIPYGIIPNRIRRAFEQEFVEYRLGHDALREFIQDYPDFMSILVNAMKSVSHEPEEVFSWCRRSAERYQIGSSTAQSHEILCLDESFAQRAFSILWRQPDKSFSLKQYFSAVPLPDVLVHVDAPPDICLERQYERGRVVVAKDWETHDPKIAQKKSQELCSIIRDYLEKKTLIVTVENTETVEKAVKKILMELPDAQYK